MSSEGLSSSFSEEKNQKDFLTLGFWRCGDRVSAANQAAV
jgi:hypothetical protein